MPLTNLIRAAVEAERLALDHKRRADQSASTASAGQAAIDEARDADAAWRDAEARVAELNARARQLAYAIAGRVQGDPETSQGRDIKPDAL
jgi:hypothetical protein